MAKKLAVQRTQTVVWVQWIKIQNSKLNRLTQFTTRNMDSGAQAKESMNYSNLFASVNGKQ